LLYSIFDDEPLGLSFGNDKTEAVENARLGLERMERNSELRIRMTRPVSGGAVDEGNRWQVEPFKYDHFGMI